MEINGDEEYFFISDCAGKKTHIAVPYGVFDKIIQAVGNLELDWDANNDGKNFPINLDFEAIDSIEDFVLSSRLGYLMDECNDEEVVDLETAKKIFRELE